MDNDCIGCLRVSAKKEFGKSQIITKDSGILFISFKKAEFVANISD